MTKLRVSILDYHLMLKTRWHFEAISTYSGNAIHRWILLCRWGWYWFGMVKQSCLASYTKWLNVMYSTLNKLTFWPDAETLHKNLPEWHYKCIIDCFDSLLRAPMSLTERASKYSNYQSHYSITTSSLFQKLGVAGSPIKLLLRSQGFLNQEMYNLQTMASTSRMIIGILGAKRNSWG